MRVSQTGPPTDCYPTPIQEGHKLKKQENRLTKIVNLTQECSKERLKGKEGTRQTQASPVYQKHRLLTP